MTHVPAWAGWCDGWRCTECSGPVLDGIDRSQVVDWAVAEMLADAELPGLVELAALSEPDTFVHELA